MKKLPDNPQMPELTNERISEIINKDFLNYENFTSVVKATIHKVMAPYNEKIKQIEVLAKRAARYEDDVFVINDNLISYLSISIPNICLEIQGFLNDQDFEASFMEFIQENKMTEKLNSVVGRDAKERQRMAEKATEAEQIIALVKRQICKNLKALIERCDKLYEGIKKVHDGLNREKLFSGRT